MARNTWHTINRDPFAREELQRRSIPDPNGRGCLWCGQSRRGGRLFQYAIDPDSITPRRSVIPGAYCSVGCMRSNQA